MITVAREITDIKSEFEGGNALSVDWYAILRRAADNVLDNVVPETLKRRVAIYGGLAKNVFVYYCPADVLVPSAIYKQPEDRTPAFRFVPPNEFYSQALNDTFTIETINGARFLILKHGFNSASDTIDEMDEVGTKVSDQTLSLNENDFVSGTGAVQRTFSEESGTAFTVDAGTDFATSPAHGLSNGDRIMVFSSTTLPAGLSLATVYFVVNKTANTFQLSLTSGGAAIDLTDAGTGTHKFHTATQNEVSDVITALDITDFLKGTALVNAIIDTAEEISRVELVLEETTAKYYTLTSTADSIGDYLMDGLNQIRFSLANAVITGSPASTNIVKWRLRIYTTSGTSQTIIIDKIELHKSAHAYFEYYSNRMFVDGTSGAWKDTPVSGDSINLTRDAGGILHYEAVVLIAQNSTFVSVSEKEMRNFTGQLKRKYDAHFGRHPSTEQPMSYNHLDGVENDEFGGVSSFGKEQLDVEVQDP